MRRAGTSPSCAPPSMPPPETEGAPVDTRTIELDTTDGPMPLYEAQPDGAARGAVIVVQEAFGVNSHIEDVTRRFADTGYHAVAPHFFHRAGAGRHGARPVARTRARLPLRPTRRVRRDRRQGRLEPDVGLVRGTHGGRDVKDMTDALASDCDLCEAARITPWYHEDDICWIAECEICAVPMVVWREHGREPSAADLEHMLDQLGRIAAEQLTVEHYVDDNMRNIPDHFHAHARPRGGFFGHGFRKT